MIVHWVFVNVLSGRGAYSFFHIFSSRPLGSLLTDISPWNPYFLPRLPSLVFSLTRIVHPVPQNTTTTTCLSLFQCTQTHTTEQNLSFLFCRPPDPSSPLVSPRRCLGPYLVHPFPSPPLLFIYVATLSVLHLQCPLYPSSRACFIVASLVLRRLHPPASSFHSLL